MTEKYFLSAKHISGMPSSSFQSLRMRTHTTEGKKKFPIVYRNYTSHIEGVGLQFVSRLNLNWISFKDGGNDTLNMIMLAK